MTENFDERALSRIVRISVVLAIVGAIVTFLKYSPANAAGFLAGSTLSIVSFHGLRRMVQGISGGSKAPSAALFALRYLLVGGAAYVIVKILEITLMPVLAGLFVAAAAVIVEIFYELIYART